MSIEESMAMIASLQQQLAERNAELNKRAAELATKEKQIAILDKQLKRQQTQLEQLIRQLKRLPHDPDHPDQLLFDALIIDVLEHCDSTLQEELAPPEDKDESPPEDQRHKKKKRYKKPHPGRRPLPEHLPREIVILDIPDDEKIDPITGEERKVMRVEITEKLDVIPGQLRVIQYHRRLYPEPDGKGIQIPDLPPFALPKIQADHGLLADIAVKRFADHLPYYRQSQALARQGIELHRNVLDNWMIQLGTDTFLPLYHALDADIRTEHYTGFDATPLPLQIKGNGKLHTAQLWVKRAGTAPHHVYFHFALTKEAHEVDALLGPDFQGYGQADAASSHDALFKREGVHEIGCWAHTTRKFKAALPTAPADAAAILTHIGNLYQVEKAARALSPDERHALRQRQAAPTIDAIFKLLTAQLTQHLPKSPMATAIAYAINQEKPLRAYLQDGRLAIDNNAVERALRPLGIGRRNWTFAASERGGLTAAVFLSLYACCRELKINFWLYLKDLLDRIVEHPPERIRELLPGYWQPLPANANLGVPIHTTKPDQSLHDPTQS